MRKVVVLPQPEGPKSVMKERSSITKFKFSTAALLLPNFFVIFFKTIFGIFSPYSFINRSTRQLINNPVGQQYNQYNQQIDSVSILVPALLIVLEEHGGQHC